jgi:hypothetical protein
MSKFFCTNFIFITVLIINNHIFDNDLWKLTWRIRCIVKKSNYPKNKTPDLKTGLPPPRKSVIYVPDIQCPETSSSCTTEKVWRGRGGGDTNHASLCMVISPPTKPPISKHGTEWYRYQVFTTKTTWSKKPKLKDLVRFDLDFLNRLKQVDTTSLVSWKMSLSNTIFAEGYFQLKY